VIAGGAQVIVVAGGTGTGAEGGAGGGGGGGEMLAEGECSRGGPQRPQRFQASLGLRDGWGPAGLDPPQNDVGLAKASEPFTPPPQDVQVGAT
jgi:hypothetical protein